MRYFLVDTENINQYDFIEEFNLTNEDAIVLFVSERAKKIRLEDLMNITQRNIQVEYEKVYTGTGNALDFQLVAKLSILICTLNKNTQYFIVSNDNGFNAAVKYLKEKMSANIEIIKLESDEIAIEIENLNIDDEYELDELTKEIIDNSGTLCELHNKLRALYGNEKGRELYLKLKKGFGK